MARSRILGSSTDDALHSAILAAHNLLRLVALLDCGSKRLNHLSHRLRYDLGLLSGGSDHALYAVNNGVELVEVLHLHLVLLLGLRIGALPLHPNSVLALHLRGANANGCVCINLVL